MSATIDGTVPTWATLRSSLPAGLSAETLELVRRSTSAVRRRAREAVVGKALAEYLGAPDDVAMWFSSPELANHDDKSWFFLGAALCLLELNGTGGHLDAGMGTGDRSTTRMEWARKLGAGRARAMDAPAWDAAIRSVGERLAFGFVSGFADEKIIAATVVKLIRDYFNDAMLPFALAYARSRLVKAARHFARTGSAEAIGLWDEVLKEGFEELAKYATED